MTPIEERRSGKHLFHEVTLHDFFKGPTVDDNDWKQASIVLNMSD